MGWRAFRDRFLDWQDLTQACKMAVTNTSVPPGIRVHSASAPQGRSRFPRTELLNDMILLHSNLRRDFRFCLPAVGIWSEEGCTAGSALALGDQAGPAGLAEELIVSVLTGCRLGQLNRSAV